MREVEKRELTKNSEVNKVDKRDKFTWYHLDLTLRTNSKSPMDLIVLTIDLGTEDKTFCRPI